MSIRRARRAATRAILWGCVFSALGFSCDKSVNDDSVSLLVTVRASLGDDNQQGGGDVLNGDVRVLALSADGRYVAFVSKAENLVDNDGNGDADVFLRDMVGRTTILVSVGLGGVSGNAASGQPSISADGQYVAFVSAATDMHADDGDGVVDVFVRDVLNGTTTLVSRNSASGPKGDGDCANPNISADGRYVVFETFADNLDGFDGIGPTGGADTDALSDIYRRDVLDPVGGFQTILISRATDTPGTPITPGAKGNLASLNARASADGNLVVFESLASNLVLVSDEGGPDSNGFRDCFVRDVLGGATRRVTLSSAQGNPNGPSDVPSISADGRFVAYRSNASNIHPDDDGQENDIFLYDLLTETVIICSQHTFGTQAGNSCSFPIVTGDGRFVVFQSGATSLVNGDSNGRTDIFRHDRLTRETNRVAVSTYGGELNGESLRPTVSSDGQYIAFVTDATNAADDDSNGAVDVYLRGPPR
jgi:Tol biopolymer transport system component